MVPVDRAGKRARDIKFHSKKNGKLVLVHSEEARAAAGCGAPERDSKDGYPGRVFHAAVGQ